MIKTYTTNGQPPTDEQLKEVEEAKKQKSKKAKKHPIVFDKDCEELSPAMIKAFRCAAIQRNRRRKA